MKPFYSIPTIFHLSIGHEDTPDYIRVCAHIKDSMTDVLTYFQSSPESMLYGPFKTISYDSACNIRNAERVHYKLELVPRLKQSHNPQATKAP